MKLEKRCIAVATALLLALVCAAALSGQELLFLPASCNPILAPGPPGAWDSGTIFLPKALVHDGHVYLFYSGTAGVTPEMGPVSIGVAVSNDGLTFANWDDNPILASGSGFDAYAVSEGVPFFDGESFVLLYNARQTVGHGPGRSIGRASAPAAEGPWKKDAEAVLTVGPPGAWDSGFVSPNCVVTTQTGYVLYYSGGCDFIHGRGQLDEVR